MSGKRKLPPALQANADRLKNGEKLGRKKKTAKSTSQSNRKSGGK